MKIFNIENNKEVIYVQLDDLAMLMHSNEVIPAVIVNEVFGNGIVIIDSRNRNEFVRFDDDVAVEYLKNADWIVDFKAFYKLSEDVLVSHGEVINDEMNKIANEFNSYPPEERKNHIDLRDKHDLLEHKFLSLPKILWFKQGFMAIPFPEVIDSDGFVIKPDDSNSPYEVRQGLNPYQSFLFRTDGKALTDEEEIPLGLWQSAQSLLIMNNMECNEFFGQFEQTRKLSDDKKYFITTLKNITKEEEKEQTKGTKLTFGKKVKQFLDKLIKG